MVQEPFSLTGRNLRAWIFLCITSMDNPMEIATMDEKIDELKVKILEIEINIERAFAEIEYACVDVEKRTEPSLHRIQ